MTEVEPLDAFLERGRKQALADAKAGRRIAGEVKPKRKFAGKRQAKKKAKPGC